MNPKSLQKIGNNLKNSLVIKTVQIFLDLLMLTAAFVLAYLLRFDFDLTEGEARIAFLQLLIAVPLQFWILRLCKVHRFIWRYISLPEIKRITTALLLAALPLLALRLAFSANGTVPSFPISIIIVDYFLAVSGILGIRLIRREIYENLRRAETHTSTADKKPILLVGAGRAGVMTSTELKNRHELNYVIKGFVDDDTSKIGSFINGIKVIGTTENIPSLVKSLEIETVVITMAQATRREFRRIHNICKRAGVKVKTIPGLSELLEDKISVSRIRDVELEDLLGRSPVKLDAESIRNFLADKTVLVTGAGGSIGSELVRQLLYQQPCRLILVERSEFALFGIEQEIAAKHPQIEITPVIADICDENRMRGVFENYQPHIVFHAAAHKHVPLMEKNPAEAIKNNVLGTKTIGNLAGQHGVEAFVLISTDKAVNPTSIMGASKRAAELVIQDLNRRFETRFMAVRFGNVIGSNGSVIPIFKEQIKNGGPVTVTHPKMERFFMTIPEASQLVLQAGAIGGGSEIFILDMGDAVKILDIARETILLSGFEPDDDIQIVFTGVRPGEKLYEELETDREKLLKTAHSKIFIGQIDSYPAFKIREALAAMEELCRTENDFLIRRFLSGFLPESNLEMPHQAQTAQSRTAKNAKTYKLATAS